MADLQVLCDDCLRSLGISAAPMAKTKPAAMEGPLMQLPLGDSYLCECGRFYSTVHGYFSFVEDRGVVRNQTQARCNSDHLSPMYMTKVLSPEKATFACPKCGKTRDEDVRSIFWLNVFILSSPSPPRLDHHLHRVRRNRFVYRRLHVPQRIPVAHELP
jgi:hypothetical protein